MNLTKSVVERLEIPIKIKEGRTGQKKYYDDKLKGFGLRVTSGGTKAFFVEKLINSDLKRITIGHHPDLTVEAARKQAHILLGKIAKGINPLAEKKLQQLQKITLKQAFNDYLKARKALKPRTIQDYHAVLREVMPDWLDKPLTNIKRETIAKRHSEHGETRSKARANLAMRLLRAIFNFSINQYQIEDGKPIITDNPIARLSHTRSWYKIIRKQTVIKNHQLADWYKGILKLSEYFPSDAAEMWQDYFLFILFTGLRRSEATELKWNQYENLCKRLQTICLNKCR